MAMTRGQIIPLIGLAFLALLAVFESQNVDVPEDRPAAQESTAPCNVEPFLRPMLCR